jgi:predicted ester cyclase
MAASENKALVRRFYEEACDQGKLDVIDELFAEEYVRHITADFRAAFPDLLFDVEIVIAEDEFVDARWTARGMHTGRWAEVEPTGRTARFSGVNIFRFENGKVSELWNHRDDLGLMEQVGAPIYAGARPEA